MTRSRIDFRIRKVMIISTALLALTTLGATTAAAQTSATAPAPSTRLHLGVSTPLVVPFGYSSSVGVGVLPGAQLSLGNHFGINLSAGYLHYTDSGKYTEREVPVLLGVTYVFMDPMTRARPYVGARLGYTNSLRDGHTDHWLTASASAGALIRLGRGFALDLGGGIVISDLTGGADETAGLLLKIGLAYRL